MVKGNKRESTGTTNTKYVGFTKVEVVAVNPTRSELNKLYGKEDSEDDKEIEYLGEDKEGNPRVRLAFYLKDTKLDKFFVHSFNLTKKTRMNNNEDKVQFVNQTCNTGWAPLEDGVADESALPEFFTNFQDKNKQNLGTKIIRQALLGEEELVTFIRGWLGRLNWNSPDAEVLVDTEALFNEDYSELRGLIDSDYDAPFVILLGVQTDENDAEKQYQKVWHKSFLPGSLMKDIEKNKFNDYGKKAYDRFVKDVTGEYGFSSHYELSPIKEYDASADLNKSTTSKADVKPTNAKF